MQVLMIYVYYLLLIGLLYAHWHTSVKFGNLYFEVKQTKKLHIGWHLFAIFVGLTMSPSKFVHKHVDKFTSFGFWAFVFLFIYVNLL